MRFCPEGMDRVNVNAWRTTKRFPFISLFLSLRSCIQCLSCQLILHFLSFPFVLSSLWCPVRQKEYGKRKEKENQIRNQRHDDREGTAWVTLTLLCPSFLFLSLLSFFDDWLTGHQLWLQLQASFNVISFSFCSLSILFFFIFTPCSLIWWLLFISPLSLFAPFGKVMEMTKVWPLESPESSSFERWSVFSVAKESFKGMCITDSISDCLISNVPRHLQ